MQPSEPTAAQDRRDPVARALLADEGQKELRAKRRAVDARLAEDQAATITESRKDEMDDVEMSGRSDPPFSKHGWVGGFRGLDAPSADPTAGLFHLPTTEGRPWRVIVNGQPTMLPITPETRFDRIVKPALEQTGNTRYPEDAWEIRDRRGKLLYNGGRLGFETVGALQERGEIADETLSINLKPGVGA